MSNPGQQTIHTILRAVLDMGGTATIQQLRDQTDGIYLGNLLRAATQASTEAGHLTRERAGIAYIYTLTEAGKAAALADYAPPKKASSTSRRRPITPPPPDLQAQRAAAADMRRAELAAQAEEKLTEAELAINDALMDRGPMTSQELQEAAAEATGLSAKTIITARRRMQQRGEVEKLTCVHIEYPGRRRDEAPVYRLARRPCTLPPELRAIHRPGVSR